MIAAEGQLFGIIQATKSHYLFGQNKEIKKYLLLIQLI